MEVRWADKAGKTNLWKYKRKRAKRKVKVFNSSGSVWWFDEDDKTTEKKKTLLRGKRTKKAESF